MQGRARLGESELRSKLTWAASQFLNLGGQATWGASYHIRIQSFNKWIKIKARRSNPPSYQIRVGTKLGNFSKKVTWVASLCIRMG